MQVLIRLTALAVCCAATVVRADVLYVDLRSGGANNGSSWADAFKTIEQSLAVAQPGDEVWVAEGTYYPPDVASPLEFPSGVALYGGFKGSETTRDERDIALYRTTISGDYNGDDLPGFGNRADNAMTLVSFDGTDAATRLDGFTLSGGYAHGPVTGYGGAIQSAQGAGTIENCRFIDNFAEYDGGAVWLQDVGDIVVRGCTFRGNAAGDGESTVSHGGAISLLTGDGVWIEDCRFTGNAVLANTVAFGGAVRLRDVATASIVGCTFEDNFVEAVNTFGGAVRLYDVGAAVVGCDFIGNRSDAGLGGFGGGLNHDASPEGSPDIDIVACRFLGNSAIQGGAVLTTSEVGMVRVVGSLVASNTAARGAGLYLTATAFLDASTIAHNSSSDDILPVGAGVFSTAAGVITVRNSILWDNRADGRNNENTQIYDPGGPVIGYSCVQGWSGTHGGPGNIGLDPLFRDVAGADGQYGTEDDDLDLGPFSPCIDAGSNSVLPADAMDLDGDGDTGEALPLDVHLNPRRVDDPDVADSGQGTAPVVDMGAAEAQDHSCVADFNYDGSVNTLDVLAFLNAWAAGDAGADINDDGTVNTLDVLVYLNLWNTGC
ncbi:MAG: right-handed parallel beta-helix repeat-containing protein [Phycisphaerales bacterium JB054]